MIKWLIRRLIPNSENVTDKGVRERYGVLACTLGILCNMLLFTAKLAAGLAVRSIAVISDAFNNLSDLGASVVAIIGVKMSNRHADREHPFGHGRVEYISALIVSFLIMMVGMELLKGSVGKIFHPEQPQLHPALFVILSVSIFVKLWMFSYNRYIGKKIHSGVISANASDSLNDVLATGAVIVSAAMGNFVSFPVDGVAGLIVSLLILYAGFQIARDTIGTLLGSPPDPEMVEEIQSILLSKDGITGLHDLIVHDYGPGRIMASVHAEVSGDSDIVKIHEVIDRAEKDIYHELGVNIVIHMDPTATNSRREEALRRMTLKTVKAVDEALNMHDFHMRDEGPSIRLSFDLEIPCGRTQREREKIVEEIRRRLCEKDARFRVVIEVDDAF